MNKRDCARHIASLSPEGEELLNQHLELYDGKILLHVLAADLVNLPLIDFLRNPSENKDKIKQYCNAIELMWKTGNDDVVNVVEVTILERLTDESVIWSKFGSHISNDFKRYINYDYLKRNKWLGDIKPLK